MTPKTDDGSSPALTAITGFKYYGTVYNTFYVNNDGSITFKGPAQFSDTTMYAPGTTTAVCAFCADISINNGGTVWYRQTTDAAFMAELAETAQQFGMFDPGYSPVSALVVTWEDVADYFATPDKRNTFQAVLATDNETSSMVLLLYDKMTWVRDTIDYATQFPEADPATLPQIRTQAGFISGVNNELHLLDGSWSNELINVTLLSNIGIPGKYLFRVDVDITEPTFAATNTTTETTAIPPSTTATPPPPIVTTATTTTPTTIPPSTTATPTTPVAATTTTTTPTTIPPSTTATPTTPVAATTTTTTPTTIPPPTTATPPPPIATTTTTTTPTTIPPSATATPTTPVAATTTTTTPTTIPPSTTATPPPPIAATTTTTTPTTIPPSTTATPTTTTPTTTATTPTAANATGETPTISGEP
ncbi:mucin-7-like isoform X2 [Gigantopelta aegis]|uniref:mucin-7-like isoform X2 n=1 Tax=Gigantopelta aegis TaxID=1735272 RepID=UPI001B8887D2|nr:mucin-7-like isoform X2 [Gigantopelta aegis]